MAGCSVGADMRQFQKNMLAQNILFFHIFLGFLKKAHNSFDYSKLVPGSASSLAALPPSWWTETPFRPSWNHLKTL